MEDESPIDIEPVEGAGAETPVVANAAPGPHTKALEALLAEQRKGLVGNILAAVTGARKPDAAVLDEAEQALSDGDYHSVFNILCDGTGAPKFPDDSTAMSILACMYIATKAYGASVECIENCGPEMLYNDKKMVVAYVTALVALRKEDDLEVLVSVDNAPFAEALTPALAKNILNIIDDAKLYSLLYKIAGAMMEIHPYLARDPRVAAHYTRGCNYMRKHEDTIKFFGGEKGSSPSLHDAECVKNLAYAHIRNRDIARAEAAISRGISGGIPVEEFHSLIRTLVNLHHEDGNTHGAEALVSKAIREWRMARRLLRNAA